ncbi:cubilin isoform X2 [Octopus sinensis]|nr:cubilin isoform X2 [Octopus sinensis]
MYTTQFKMTPFIILGLILQVLAAADSVNDCLETKNLTASTSSWQLIQSPGYFSKYVKNMSCSWLIYAGDPNYSLQVDWQRVDIEYSLGCYKDFVQIYRGFDRSGELLDHRCGQSSINVNNIGRYAYIYFHTDNTIEREGFSLKYKSTNSGSKICTATTSYTSHPYSWQTITSPYYPDNYLDSLSCNWLITTDDALEIVKLKVLDTEMENSTDCSKDVVHVYDGGTPRSPKLGSWCGSDTPEFISTGRKMYITFITNDKAHFRGFKAKFISEQKGVNCSGVTKLTAYPSIQYLTTPNYPHFYASNLSCSWLINSGSRSGKLYLDVRDSDIEYSIGCMKDYAELYLGTDRKADIFSRWCGGTRRKFYTYHASLFIHFHSDASLTGRGFQLSYYMGSPSAACRDKTLLVANRHGWKEFNSPFYPTVYEGNLSCWWILTAANEFDIVELQVLDFEVEDSPGCVYDSVKVFDGGNVNSPSLDRWCGVKHPSFISTGQKLMVQFETDDSYDYKGFKMRYIARDVSFLCGPGKYLKAELEERKYLVSPNLISPLYSTVKCEWQITTKNADELVKLEVAFSSLDNSTNCDDNYIAVYDGATTNAKLLGKKCGNQTLTFVSSSWSVYVVLQLKKSNRSNALLATFYSEKKEAQCKDIDNRISFSDQKNYISSPEFPRIYRSMRSCSWLLTTSKNQVIRLEIMYADFPQESQCMSNAYLAVYDGNSRRDGLLGVVCGNEPKTYISTGQQMMVLLKGHTNLTGRFLAAYYSERKAEECIGSSQLTAQRHTKNYLHTPSFPTPFKKNSKKSSHCAWVIASDGPDVVKLSIIYSKLSKKEDCSEESISVYDGDLVPNRFLGMSCGEAKPSYTSTGKKLMVIFSSKSSNGSHGFLGSYYSVPNTNSPSQDRLVAMSSAIGYIHPPNFPQPYQSSMSRSWSIRSKNADENVVLEVAFSDIYLSSGCETDSVSVYDGPTEYDVLLGKWCGDDQPKFVTSNRDMLVVFHTNSTAEHTGFLASYHTELQSSRFKHPNHIWLCIALLILIILVGCFLLGRYLFRKYGHHQWSGKGNKGTESMGSRMDIYDHASTSVSMKSLLETF